jgi:hypothetical protein
MIMECTYGDKPHNEPELAYQELQQVVRRTLERGGKVIIPAFAVGRTQDLVYNLHQMMDASELPHVPVIVDSPLAVNASDIYKPAECFDEGAPVCCTIGVVRTGLRRAGLHPLGGRLESLERTQGPDDHHLCLRHGGERSHPPPPEKQHREPAQHHPDRFLAGPGYPGSAPSRAGKAGNDLWRNL